MKFTSWDINDRKLPERYFILASAYIKCSLYIFESMSNGALDSDYSNGHIGGLLFGHSLELFLKGSIIQVRDEVKNIHSLEKLFNEFKNIYPGNTYKFTGDIGAFIEQDKSIPYSEFFRYPIDKNGNVWGNFFYDLETWKTQIEKFKNDYERLLPLVKNEQIRNE